MFMTTIKLETNQRRFTCNYYLFISTVIVVTPYVRVHKVYFKKTKASLPGDRTCAHAYMMYVTPFWISGLLVLAVAVSFHSASLL